MLENSLTVLMFFYWFILFCCNLCNIIPPSFWSFSVSRTHLYPITVFYPLILHHISEIFTNFMVGGLLFCSFLVLCFFIVVVFYFLCAAGGKNTRQGLCSKIRTAWPKPHIDRRQCAYPPPPQSQQLVRWWKKIELVHGLGWWFM
jgi:hypothetical protein